MALLKKYIDSDVVEKMVAEKEVLTTEQLFNEYIMTSLRTSWGCDSEHINNVFGAEYANYFTKNIKPFLSEGKVDRYGNRYILTNHGKLFADGIAMELMRVS